MDAIQSLAENGTDPMTRTNSINHSNLLKQGQAHNRSSSVVSSLHDSPRKMAGFKRMSSSVKIDDDAVSTYSAVTFDDGTKDSEDGRSVLSRLETLVIIFAEISYAVVLLRARLVTGRVKCHGLSSNWIY